MSRNATSPSSAPGLILLCLTMLFGCQSDQGAGDGAAVPVDPIGLDSPAGAGSRYPNLAVDSEKRVYLTWFEAREDGAQALMWSRLDGEEWSEPGVIAEGDSFFVNWADFPSLLPLDGERLVAHWPWKSGGDTYAYDVKLAFSSDGGNSWREPMIPHDDNTPTEHGFVSMIPESDGVRAIWLDGRGFAGGGGHDGHDGQGGNGEDGGPSMTLRTAVVSPDGSVSDGEIIDERTCDCCPTSMVATSNGILVAYRDRDEREIRDISILHHDRAGWSEPRTLHADGWKIAACPVNGPALVACGDNVVAAWYSEAGEDPRVLAVTSKDGGRSFGAPLELQEGDAIGRVDAVCLEDGSSLVTWVEGGESGASIKLRRIRPDQTLSSITTVAETSTSRAAGFPRMIRAGDRLVFAWTEVGEPPRVRLAACPLPG